VIIVESATGSQRTAAQVTVFKQISDVLINVTHPAIVLNGEIVKTEPVLVIQGSLPLTTQILQLEDALFF